jgi:hypothetical protein
VAREYVPPEKMPALLRTHPWTYLILIDRSDSDWYLANARVNADYLSQLEASWHLTPLHDAKPDAVDRLRIWKIEGCVWGS